MTEGDTAGGDQSVSARTVHNNKVKDIIVTRLQCIKASQTEMFVYRDLKKSIWSDSFYSLPYSPQMSAGLNALSFEETSIIMGVL